MDLALNNAFFDFCGAQPIQYLNTANTVVENKEKKNNKRLSAKIEGNSYNEAENDTIRISDTKHNLTILRPAFCLYYDLKFDSLSVGSKTIDNSGLTPFITRVFMGTLDDKTTIRIEFNNCGLAIGTGEGTFKCWDNRKYVGRYDSNTFNIYTLARHLKWELPDGYKSTV